MSSELAIATAQIVEILPPNKRTEGNIQWVENSLREGSPDEVLALCKEYLGVSNSQIIACKSEIAAHGIKLDRHIAYVDQKFQFYDREINELKQKVAVQDAVNNERANMNQFLIKGVMDAQNSTNRAVVHAAKSDGSHNVLNPLIWLSLGFGIVIISVGVSALQDIQDKAGSRTTDDYVCGIHANCVVTPLERPAPASNQFKGGV